MKLQNPGHGQISLLDLLPTFRESTKKKVFISNTFNVVPVFVHKYFFLCKRRVDFLYF